MGRLLALTVGVPSRGTSQASDSLKGELMLGGHRGAI